jgi:KDO2-lipid IV(A) lauroyltransferase
MSEKVQNIVYAPLGLFLHAVALLPLRALYAFADFLFFVVYYLLRYRRSIALKNIRDSFPEKSDLKCRKICRDFYRHFADYFVETIKLLHISDDEMRRRMEFRNVEFIDECLDSGRSAVVYLGHYGNWEWVTSITLWSRHTDRSKVLFTQVYRPLNNQWFDRFFLRLRGRFHSVGFPKKTVFRSLLTLKRDGILSVTGFMSDQHPSINDQDHVVRFLNHDTALITGTEILARRLDNEVLYFDVAKPSRGHYVCTIRKIATDPNAVHPFYITDRYARLLQDDIVSDPSIWLWTHNRWKHKVKSASPLSDVDKEIENE